MKFAIACALAVGLALGQTTTENECWYEEGADYKGQCNDLFFTHCEEFSLKAGKSCNVFAYSRSAIKSEAS